MIHQTTCNPLAEREDEETAAKATGLKEGANKLKDGGLGIRETL